MVSGHGVMPRGGRFQLVREGKKKVTWQRTNVCEAMTVRLALVGMVLALCTHLLVKENNYIVKYHKCHEKRSRWQVGTQEGESNPADGSEKTFQQKRQERRS